MNNILIVDDDSQTRDLLAKLLSSHGYTVHEAANSIDALANARHQPPQVVISTILLPQMDGYTLCHAFRQDERLMRIPFIFHTAAQIELEDQELARYLTAAHFLAKPADAATLIELVGAVLNEPVAERTPQSEALVEQELAYYRRYTSVLTRKLNARMHDLEQANRALSESETRLEGIIATAMDAIITLDEQQSIVVFNTAAERIFGCSAAEALGQRIDRFLPPRFRAIHTEHIRRFAATGVTSRAMGALLPLAALRSTGEEFPIEASISHTMVHGKRFFSVILRDVSARVQNESALRQSEERFAKAFHASPVAISLTQHADGRFIDVNDSFLALLGAPSRDTVIGKTVLDLQAGISAEFVATLTEEIRLHGRISNLETQFTTLNGETRDVMVSVETIELNGEDCNLTLAYDITERKTYELELERSAAANAALYEQTERRLRQLLALRTIDQSIAGSLDLRRTLDVIAEQTTIHLNISAATVLLLNSYTLTLTYGGGHGFRHREIEQSRLRLGEGLAGRVAFERRMLIIPNLDASQTPFIRSSLIAREGFVSYAGIPLIIKGQIRGILETFHNEPLAPKPDWVVFFETLAQQTAIAIDNAQLFDGLQQTNLELTLAYDETIAGWSRALDLRDKETEGHTQRVTDSTERLARAIGLRDQEIVHIRRGALLHDIGKMAIPDSILLKPGPLTEAEWDIMRRHPQYAYDLLAPIAYLQPALDIPYCHHEKWDGSGYPRGLKGEQIPIAARIFAVIDVWDALRSDRPYRAAWPDARVIEHIRMLSGSHFDPRVVTLFSQILQSND